MLLCFKKYVNDKTRFCGTVSTDKKTNRLNAIFFCQKVDFSALPCWFSYYLLYWVLFYAIRLLTLPSKVKQTCKATLKSKMAELSPNFSFSTLRSFGTNFLGRQGELKGLIQLTLYVHTTNMAPSLSKICERQYN